MHMMSLRRHTGSVTVLADAVHFPMFSASGPLFCRVTHEALASLDGAELPLAEEDAVALFELYRGLIESAASRQFARGVYYVTVRSADVTAVTWKGALKRGGASDRTALRETL